MGTSFATVEDYIRSHPPDVQLILQQIRGTIREVAPESGETISYQMPAATVAGRDLVYYAAWNKHIGMYPVPTGDAEFEATIAPYRAVRSTVRFPYRQPIPYELIGRMVTLLMDARD